MSPTMKTLNAALNGRLAVPNRRSRGFTLIELLVCIAVIAVIISIMLPALSKGISLCRQVREQAGAGQLMLAFHAYANDSKGQVLTGYTTKKMVSGPMNVVNGAGERLTGEVAQRYPWRIIPYMLGDFRGLYLDRKVLGIMEEQKDYPDENHSYDYVVSLFPSLGMNTAWVGGSDLLGEFGKDFKAIFGRPFITRMDEPRRPTELITFASARMQEYNILPEVGRPEGFFRVDSPFFTKALGKQWQDTYDAQADLPGANSGYVSLRYSGRAVTAMFDGHAQTMKWEELNDMRHWADQATSADWALGTAAGK